MQTGSTHAATNSRYHSASRMYYTTIYLPVSSVTTRESESSVMFGILNLQGDNLPLRLELNGSTILLYRFIKLYTVTNVISELAVQFNQISVTLKSNKKSFSSRKGPFLVSPNGPKKNWRERRGKAAAGLC